MVHIKRGQQNYEFHTRITLNRKKARLHGLVYNAVIYYIEEEFATHEFCTSVHSLLGELRGLHYNDTHSEKEWKE